LTVLEQIRRQHLAIAQGRGQLANRRGCRFQLFDTGQATQWPQQAAQSTHGGAQFVQRFRVSVGTQARLAGQQMDIQP
jgi:hypothetical protein